MRYFTSRVTTYLIASMLAYMPTYIGGQQLHTVGLISISQDQVFAGYNLYYPYSQPHAYLLDNCGEIVHIWHGEPQTQPGNAARLMPDGTLIKGVRRNASLGDPIWAGGGGETIERRSWDNSLLWSFTLNNDTARLHHDFEVMPNGNILMIAWEAKSVEEAIAAGRDPQEIVEDVLWPDMLIEVDPVTDSIVWEWHAWDHLIQDFDPTKDNYGEIFAHPELIDLNWILIEGVADWLHFNSISYNPDLDLIVLSSPHFEEAWIIDHSTTTQEAAGHTGGRWGRGGDVLFRWGNPVAYGRGSADDQKLFYPHDVRWVATWNGTTHEYTGAISVFNNRVATDYSMANVFTPVMDTVQHLFKMQDDIYLPVDFDLTIAHPDTQKLWSPALSSFQILANGNYLILAGRNGYAFELTPDGTQVVWEYVNPLVNGNPVEQGDPAINNLVFRFERYPSDYPAFDGRDLMPGGFIELNPDTAFCNLQTSIRNLSHAAPGLLTLYPNPINETGEAILQLNYHSDLNCHIYNTLGGLLEVLRLSPGENRVSLGGLAAGLYYVTLPAPLHQTVVLMR